MKQGSRKGRFVVGLGLFTLVLHFSLAASAADSLDWRKDKDSVDADISSWSLLKTLESISEATGWQVYVEPGTQKKVSTKFKDRPRDRALDLLLGNLGRALLPGTNGGPPRFLVFRNTQRDATRLIRARGKARPIPNELIVRMKKGKSVDDLAKTLGAKVLGKSAGLNAGRLKFNDEESTEKAREALLDNEDVDSVEPNFPVLAQPTLEGPGGAGIGDLNIKPLKAGDPLVIAVIDTSVQLQGNAYDSFLLPAISVVDKSSSSADVPTHGTAMVATILQSIDALTPDGTTTSIKIRPVVAFPDEGGTTVFEIAAAMREALESEPRPHILSDSYGSKADSQILRDQTKQAADAGIIVIASAGNEPTTEPMYPAAYQWVDSVTAGISRDSIAPYANRSPENDLMAPGVSRIPFNGRIWTVEGTSPAAAIVAAAVGVGIANGLTPAQAAAAARRAFPLPVRAP